MVLGTKGYDVRIKFGLKQEMRDGVKLSADIYLPDVEARFPTIVTRTPYNTVQGYMKMFSDEAKFFARHGYAYVIQDCRGKNDSEGEFQPFFDDHTDGYDTLAWCAKQSWCNGSIGTMGASYQAWNQWATATLGPPNLKAMICVVSLPDPVINVPYQNGALVLWMSEWMSIVDGKRNTDPRMFDTEKNYWHLPLRTLDEKFGRTNSKIWQNWISHPSADEFWKRSFYQDKLKNVQVPVLHVSGWYDDDVIGTHLNYTRMKELGQTEFVRENQKLIIGPWQHHVNVTRRIGEIDFGESALIDLTKIKLDWFDHWLKGVDNGVMKTPKVDIFTMGTNIWKKTNSWPFEGTKYQEYYFHSAGNANTSSGDGTFSTVKPGSEPPDSFSYNPLDPCPNIYESDSLAAEGPYDQRTIEIRSDVLSYSSEILESNVEVSGPVRVKLFASTSATDTDFWAEVTDVLPNGYSLHLTEGIIRGRYRESLEIAKLMTPNQIYEFDLDLWVISNVFLKGHRIRVDISSSSFPKYDRNPNTGHKFGKDSDTIGALQKIYHDSAHPSHVLLPIVRS